MKLLYISTIVRNSSFGEVSRKYVKMFEKYASWDIYFFNINSTESEARETYKTSSQLHPTKYIPNYTLKFNNKDFARWYLDGLYHINDYILEINPDIVIMLYNDGNIYRFSKVLNEIRHIWKGLFIPFTPVDYENPLDYMFRVNYDACITMNKWSVRQIKSINGINYPVYSCPHIVDGFQKLDNNVIKQNRIKIYGPDLADKYIVGCVNANNGRKRLDLVINAFIKFYSSNPDSILYIKTTKFEKGGITTSFNLDNFTKNYPIIVTDEYLTNEQLNILYNTFDIMINATDGEGFGLTPFEAALSGTLSILPNNTSFTSLIEKDKDPPNYLIPCKLYPYEYVRNIQDINQALSGQIYHSVYYDCKSFENTVEKTTCFNNIIVGIRTYVLSRKLVPSGNVFSNMDDLIRAPWDSLQIQILVTSDLESLRHFLEWLSNNNNIIWPGKNRARKIIKLKALNNYVGTDSPRVALINTDDLCKKMIYYKKNLDNYAKDLESLKDFVVKNYNEQAVWNCFKKIIQDITKING